MDIGLAHDDMTDALLELMDCVGRSALDAASLQALAGDFRALSRRIKAAGEDASGTHAIDPMLRRGTLTPTVTITSQDERSVRGVVTFGPRYGVGKPHGGAIPLMMLDVMGRLVNAGGRPRSFTAELVTDFRSITPGDTELTVKAWLTAEDGRKRRARAELWHNERLCAGAEGLFIAASADPA